jgi:hypothetical protein
MNNTSGFGAQSNNRADQYSYKISNHRSKNSNYHKSNYIMNNKIEMITTTYEKVET